MSDPDDPVATLQRIYPPLHAFARSVVGRQEADDLVQEALIRTLIVHPRFEGLDHPLAYTKTVAVRIAYHGKSADRPVDQPAIEALLQGNAEHHQPNVELEMLIEAALDRLPARQRIAIELRYIECLSDVQIASILDCRAVSVRSYISRGLKRIRTTLDMNQLTNRGDRDEPSTRGV